MQKTFIYLKNLVMRADPKQDFDTYTYRAQGRSPEKQHKDITVVCWILGITFTLAVATLLYYWYNPQAFEK